MSAALVSKKDFAAIYGCSKAYVSQLVKAQRLVLVDGRVDVDASLELLGATADPSKAGVRERWAAYRAEHGQAAGAVEQQHQVQAAAAGLGITPGQVVADMAASSAGQAAGAAAGDLVDQAKAEDSAPAATAGAPAPRSEYQDARTRREKALAEQEEMALHQARGRLLEAEPTLRAIADAHIGVRNELLGLADRLTPLVTPETDARKVWQLISDECERLCGRVQQSAERMAQRAEVTA